MTQKVFPPGIEPGTFRVLGGCDNHYTTETCDEIHSFSILSDDRSKASSKTMPPHSAIQNLLLQMRISSPVLKVIQ